MYKHFSSLEDRLLSQEGQQAIPALDELLPIQNEMSSILLKMLKINDDRFVVAERLSAFFQSFLDGLVKNLSSKDKELAFWSAALIVSYQINNDKAENILLDAVLNGDADRASPAARILTRVKNRKVKAAISNRINRRDLSKKIVLFFRELLEDYSKL